MRPRHYLSIVLILTEIIFSVSFQHCGGQYGSWIVNHIVPTPYWIIQVLLLQIPTKFHWVFWIWELKCVLFLGVSFIEAFITELLNSGVWVWWSFWFIWSIITFFPSDYQRMKNQKCFFCLGMGKILALFPLVVVALSQILYCEWSLVWSFIFRDLKEQPRLWRLIVP